MPPKKKTKLDDSHVGEPTYTYVNEEAIDENLRCSFICFEPLVDPVTHDKCGHSFCRSCIEKTNYRCPCCRTGTQNEYANVKARIILNPLGSLRVQCSDCQKQMDRGDFEQHKPNCPVKCAQGCGEDVPRSKVTEHATVCTNVQVPCTANELGCTEIILRGNLQNHVQECKYEQSRWIIEPLRQETVSLRQHVDQLNNHYQQSLHELNKKYEMILQQLPNNVPNLFEHVASGSGDDIEIWNVSTGTRVKVLKGHTSSIYSIIQLSDGTLVSASWDKTIRLWNIETSECTKIYTGHTDHVCCVIQLTNGTIASGSHDQTICIWNQEQEIKTVQADTIVHCLLELEDGTLVSGGYDKMITFWNVTSGKKMKTLTGHTSAVRSVLKLEDGRLVSASMDKTIRIWQNDKCERVLEGHTNRVYNVIELTDGQLASCSHDGTIRLWNINTGESQVLTGHTEAVLSLVQISSDTIISGSLDKTIRVWKNGKQIKQMDCSGWIYSIIPVKIKT